MCGLVQYGTLRDKGENGCSFSLGKTLMLVLALIVLKWDLETCAR